ncbi:MAG: hypothetical protein SFX19_08580 [Alphaproteobacteria bacterium]|nr:hypothetical protein [Alphaproteobacteria bacterium]
MIRQEYIDFVEKFEGLNPYELDHFCKIIHQNYKVAFKEQPQMAKADLTSGDMKEIIIRAMQMVQIELAEGKVKAAEMNLELLKSKFL